MNALILYIDFINRRIDVSRSKTFSQPSASDYSLYLMNKCAVLLHVLLICSFETGNAENDGNEFVCLLVFLVFQRIRLLDHHFIHRRYHLSSRTQQDLRFFRFILTILFPPLVCSVSCCIQFSAKQFFQQR